jgi:membrane protein
VPCRKVICGEWPGGASYYLRPYVALWKTEMRKSAKKNQPSNKGVLPAFVQLLRESGSAWMAHKAPKMGAALAYYTAFSLAPLIILILSLVSLFMKRDAAAQGIVAQVSELLGADGGKVVQEILTHAGSTNTLSWSTAISFAVLLISSSAAFGELQDSLNTIWEVPPQKNPWISMIKDRLLSLSMVFVLGFLMMVSLLISTGVAGFSNWWIGSTSKWGLVLPSPSPPG